MSDRVGLFNIVTVLAVSLATSLAVSATEQKPEPKNLDPESVLSPATDREFRSHALTIAIPPGEHLLEIWIDRASQPCTLPVVTLPVTYAFEFNAYFAGYDRTFTGTNAPIHDPFKCKPEIIRLRVFGGKTISLFVFSDRLRSDGRHEVKLTPFTRN